MKNPNTIQPENLRFISSPTIGAALVLVVAAGLLVVFRIYYTAEIDLSELFFLERECRANEAEKIRCGYFPAYKDSLLVAARMIGIRLPQLIALWLVIWLTLLMVVKLNKSVLDMLIPIQGLVSFIIGPAILTNLIFKPYWGRPRPLQTIEFNGDSPYVLPGDITSYCVGNCSFVSGEATAAFWLLWVVPFLPKRLRWPVGFMIFIVACGISFLRVVYGGHFLSDVVLGGMVALFAIFISAVILQSVFVQKWIVRWHEFSNQTIQTRQNNNK